MGITSQKVVNVSILGASATLVGASAVFATVLIVVIGLIVLYKIASKPTININIG